jgi:NADH:ubiquinone oxidoreductase subunit 6 (subunit J)
MFLVLVFLSAAGLLFCLEVEFLALSFIIVYVGAIAILFLFVVMMLDIKIGDNSLSSFKSGTLGLLLCFLFSIGIILPLFEGVSVYPHPETSFFGNIKLLLNLGASNTEHPYIFWLNQIDFITNLESIGQILYTYYFVFFFDVGFYSIRLNDGCFNANLNLKKVSKETNCL